MGQMPKMPPSGTQMAGLPVPPTPQMPTSQQNSNAPGTDGGQPTDLSCAAKDGDVMQNPLQAIREGVAAQNKEMVRNAIAAAHKINTPIDPNVQAMIKQWLAEPLPEGPQAGGAPAQQSTSPSPSALPTAPPVTATVAVLPPATAPPAGPADALAPKAQPTMPPAFPSGLLPPAQTPQAGGTAAGGGGGLAAKGGGLAAKGGFPMPDGSGPPKKTLPMPLSMRREKKENDRKLPP